MDKKEKEELMEAIADIRSYIKGCFKQNEDIKSEIRDLRIVCNEIRNTLNGVNYTLTQPTQPVKQGEK